MDRKPGRLWVPGPRQVSREGDEGPGPGNAQEVPCAAIAIPKENIVVSMAYDRDVLEELALKADGQSNRNTFPSVM